MRVLLIEDNQPLRDVFAEYLTADGLGVALAGTLIEALSLVRSGAPFDAIVLDLGLPDSDPAEGRSAIEKLRDAAGSLPGIVVHSSANPDDIPGGRGALASWDAQEWVPKGDPVELRSAVHRAIGQMRGGRRLARSLVAAVTALTGHPSADPSPVPVAGSTVTR